MRKFYLFFATVLMALAFAACGSDDEDVQAGNGGGQNKCFNTSTATKEKTL